MTLAGVKRILCVRADRTERERTMTIEYRP